MAGSRLTEAQRRGLNLIAQQKPIGSLKHVNADGWMRLPVMHPATLDGLERKGAIEITYGGLDGVESTLGACRITPAGRQALSDTGERSRG